MDRVQAGFTLIEMLIVVALASIVAGFAFPAYRDYVIRGRISEVFVATSQCRALIAETYQSAPKGTSIGTDKWACGEGLTTTEYVASISTDPDGIITVTTSASATLGVAAGTTLTLTPIREDGTVLAIGDIPRKVFGFKCEPGGATPIPAKFLPVSCRV